MSENAPQATMSFDIRFMRKGKHSSVVFLPEAYHAPIGLVIAHWGHFEKLFNACLAGLIEGEQSNGGTRDTAAWKRRRFASRRRLFKEICSEWLSTWRPDEAANLAVLSDTAGSLSWKRNIIAHGAYAYSIPPMSSIATDCRALNENGDSFPFDEAILKKLYHDISHLTADLVLKFQEFGKIEGLFYSLPDTEILRAYRESNHPWNLNSREQTLPP